MTKTAAFLLTLIVAALAGIGVGVALAAMITLLPALLVIFGRWIFWPVRPGFGSPEPTRPAGHLKRLRMDSG